MNGMNWNELMLNILLWSRVGSESLGMDTRSVPAMFGGPIMSGLVTGAMYQFVSTDLISLVQDIVPKWIQAVLATFFGQSS